MSLTTAEAARVAGVSPRTVRRWIERGVLPAVTSADGVLYVFRRDLETARTATHARPSKRDSGGVRDTSHPTQDTQDRRDSPGQPDASRLSPDPGGDAAGAVLVAWRDTVLAPVVEQLAAVTQDLVRAREDVGRLGAEREAAIRERDALAARLAAERGLADRLVDLLQEERDALRWERDRLLGEAIAGPGAWREAAEDAAARDDPAVRPATTGAPHPASPTPGSPAPAPARGVTWWRRFVGGNG